MNNLYYRSDRLEMTRGIKLVNFLNLTINNSNFLMLFDLKIVKILH